MKYICWVLVFLLGACSSTQKLTRVKADGIEPFDKAILVIPETDFLKNMDTAFSVEQKSFPLSLTILRANNDENLLRKKIAETVQDSGTQVMMTVTLEELKLGEGPSFGRGFSLELNVRDLKTSKIIWKGRSLLQNVDLNWAYSYSRCKKFAFETLQSLKNDNLLGKNKNEN